MNSQELDTVSMERTTCTPTAMPTLWLTFSRSFHVSRNVKCSQSVLQAPFKVDVTSLPPNSAQAPLPNNELGVRKGLVHFHVCARVCAVDIKRHIEDMGPSMVVN